MKRLISILYVSLALSPGCLEYNPRGEKPIPVGAPNPREFIINEPVVETFRIPVGHPANVYLCIDTSGSMGGDQVNLWNNVGALIARLDEFHIDYRIGITGAGSFNIARSGVLGSYNDEYNHVTPYHDNRTGVLQDLLQLSANSNEACIDAIGWGFTSNYDANEPFWRPGEPLHIISVSDEVDQSLDFTPEMVAGVLDVHELIYDSPVTYAAVVNIYDAGGYTTLVDLMDGDLVSIFDDNWDPALDNLDYLATEFDHKYYLMEGIPDPTSIVVAVEDDNITFVFNKEDWIYNPIENSISFVEYTPKPDALIIVEYVPYR